MLLQITSNDWAICHCMNLANSCTFVIYPNMFSCSRHYCIQDLVAKDLCTIFDGFIGMNSMDWYYGSIRFKALIYVAKRPFRNCLSKKPGFCCFFNQKIYKYFHWLHSESSQVKAYFMCYIKCSCPLIWKCSFLTQKFTRDINHTKDQVQMVDEYIKACVAPITSQLMQIKIMKYNFLPLRFSKNILNFNCTHFYEYKVRKYSQINCV